MNIPVVYEDNWLLVANKPSGLLTIPTPKNEKRTLSSILNDDLKKRGESFGLHPCHRLDKETSGLIIYAKGKSTQRKMMDEFRARRVKKKYIAFAQGEFSENQGEIKNRINGQEAITKYKVIAKRRDFAILEVRPITGRTNQIRIHFKQIGHPVVGETKFSFRKDFRLKSKRLCLHAGELEFLHPVTKKFIHLSVDLAQDLKEFLHKHV